MSVVDWMLVVPLAFVVAGLALILWGALALRRRRPGAYVCPSCGVESDEPFGLHKAPRGTRQHAFRTCPGGYGVTRERAARIRADRRLAAERGRAALTEWNERVREAREKNDGAS